MRTVRMAINLEICNMKFESIIAKRMEDWRKRGYFLCADRAKRPLVKGDTSQFLCDAVSDDLDAAKLMAHLRDHNPQEYETYKNDAADDDIDLDEWVGIAADGKEPGWRSWSR
jgi:hypothetical protein